MNRLTNIVIALVAGLAGAALFFGVAFAQHWGGLDQQSGRFVEVQSPSGEAVGTVTPQPTGLTPSDIFQRFGDSVVQIVSTFPGQQGSFFHPGTQTEQGIGSGFVVSPDGYILTNAHVVTTAGDTTSNAAPTKASDVSVNFKNGKKTKAQIVGYDPTSSDVAVIKIDPTGMDLVPAVLGDSDNVQVGEQVAAIGSPFGVYASSITAGIVSATNRSVESPQAGFTINNAIQTDAAINAGNSGGPLFNNRGQVIGINEQIATQSGGSEGVGFAVPINTAKRAMDQIISKGEVDYAFMGIVGQTVDENVANTQHLSVQKGALVTDVQSGGPAEKAGLKTGDVITAFDDNGIDSMEALTSFLVQHQPGDKVKITYVRGSDSHDVDLELGSRPVRQ